MRRKQKQIGHKLLRTSVRDAMSEFPLLHLEHAQIPFRLVIRGWDGEVMEKGAYFLLMLPHGPQQVLRWRAFAARWRRIAYNSLVQDCPVVSQMPCQSQCR
jgi:hypothetical protein